MSLPKQSKTPSWMPPTGTGRDRWKVLEARIEELERQVAELTQQLADTRRDVDRLEANDLYT